MSEIRITTNNVPRNIVNAWELSAEERAEFDYLDWPAIERGESSAEFFRFKGELYDIGEFSRIISPGAARRHPMESAEPTFQGWCGYRSDSFFSGMLIKWARDDSGAPDLGRVIIGTYCS